MNKTGLADVALKALLAAAFVWGAWETRALRAVAVESNRLAEEANRNAAENNRMLKGRDFDRIFDEHARLLEKCGQK